MSEIPAKIRDYVMDAITEILGHADYQRAFKPIPEPERVDFGRMPLAATLGFVGERISGHLTLACSAEFLRLTNPVKAPPHGKEEIYARDWLGEILNLVVGHFKRKLAHHGLSFQLTPPSFQHYVRTSAMTLEEYGPVRYEESGAYQDFWFELDRTPVVFQIGIKLKEPLQ